MARHYVGITSRGPTILRNVRRAETGEPLVLMDEDAETKLTLDFAPFLESGETISAPTLEAHCVTASPTTTSPTIVLTLSDATSYDLDGRVTLQVPISNGETWRGTIRVRRTERYQDETVSRDYV